MQQTDIRNAARFMTMRSILSVMMLFVVGVLVPVQAQEQEEEQTAHASNIVETLQQHGQFSTFLSVAKKANMASTLASEGPFTVFAPTDKAFAEFEGDVESLTAEDTRVLLRHHLLGKAYTASAIAQADRLQTLKGTAVSIENRKSGVAIENGMVVEKDIKASNGVIHAVDHLIVPSDMSKKLKQMEMTSDSAE